MLLFTLSSSGIPGSLPCHVVSIDVAFAGEHVCIGVANAPIYSPEDHAILEAEYQRHPKPDKVTRANIVSRVSLGDKEVQVCFPAVMWSTMYDRFYKSLEYANAGCFLDMVPKPEAK